MINLIMGSCVSGHRLKATLCSYLPPYLMPGYLSHVSSSIPGMDAFLDPCCQPRLSTTPGTPGHTPRRRLAARSAPCSVPSSVLKHLFYLVISVRRVHCPSIFFNQIFKASWTAPRPMMPMQRLALNALHGQTPELCNEKRRRTHHPSKTLTTTKRSTACQTAAPILPQAVTEAQTCKVLT